jgi:18S rRNA (adenine1779-N6/adenine1780-N6)-dimethyltransferase
MIDGDANMKAKVEEVLSSSGYSEQRAAKMTLDDLLK